MFDGESDSSEDWDEQLRHEQLDAKAAAGSAMPSAWGAASGAASGVQAIRGMFKHGGRGGYGGGGGGVAGAATSASARLASVLEEGGVSPAAITAALFDDSDSVTTMSVSSDGGSSSPLRLVHAGSVASGDSGGPAHKLSPLEDAKLQAAQYAMHAKPGGAHVRSGAPMLGMPAPLGNVLPACLETALSFDAQAMSRACGGDPLVPPSFLQSSQDGDCSAAWGLAVPLDLPQGAGAALGSLGQGFGSSHELGAHMAAGAVYRDMHRSLLCAPILPDAQPIPDGFWVPPRPVASVSRGGSGDRRLSARQAPSPRDALCAIVRAVCNAALQTPTVLDTARSPAVDGMRGPTAAPPATPHRMTLSGEIAPPASTGAERVDVSPPAVPSVGLHSRGQSLLPADTRLVPSRAWRSGAFDGQASSGAAFAAAQTPGKGRQLTGMAAQLVRGVCSAAPLPAPLAGAVHSSVEDPMGGEGGSPAADEVQREVAAAVRAGMAALAQRLGADTSKAVPSDVGRMWVQGASGGAVPPLSPMWLTVHVVLVRDALAHATAADDSRPMQHAAGVALATAAAGSLLGHSNDLLTGRNGHTLAEQLWLPAVFEACMDVLTQLLRVAHLPPALGTWLAGRQGLARAHAHFRSQTPEAGAHASHESTASGGAAVEAPLGMRHAPTAGVLSAKSAAPGGGGGALDRLRRHSMSGRHLTAPIGAASPVGNSGSAGSAVSSLRFLAWLGGHSPALHVLATQGPRLDAAGCVAAAQVCLLHRLLGSAVHDLLLLSSLPWGQAAPDEEEAASDRLQRHVRLVAWQAAARQHIADALHAPLPQFADMVGGCHEAFPSAEGRSGGLLGLAGAAWLLHSWLQCEHRSPLHLTPERQHALALLSGCLATAVCLVKSGGSTIGMLGVAGGASSRGMRQGDTQAFDNALHRAMAAVGAAAAADVPAPCAALCTVLPRGGCVWAGGPPPGCTAAGEALLRHSVVMHPRSALHDTVASMLAQPAESDVWLAATLLTCADALSAPVLANILATNALPGIALSGRGASSLPVPQRGVPSAGVVPPLMPSLLVRSAGVAAAPPPQLADMQPTRYTGEIDYSAAPADAAAAADGASDADAPPCTPPRSGHVRSRSMLGIHVTVVVDPAGWLTVLTATALQATALQLGALQRWLALSPWVEGTAQQLVLGVQGGRGGPQWRPGFDWSSIDQLQAKHDADKAEGAAAGLDSHARLQLLRRCAALLRLLHFSGQQLQAPLRGGGGGSAPDGGPSALRVVAKTAEGLLLDAARVASAAPVGGFMAILALAEPLPGAGDGDSFIILPAPADVWDEPFTHRFQQLLMEQLGQQLDLSLGGEGGGASAALKGAVIDLQTSQVFNTHVLQAHGGSGWVHLQSADGCIAAQLQCAAVELAHCGLWGRAALYLHALWLHAVWEQDTGGMVRVAMQASDAWVQCGHGGTAQQVLLDSALLLLGAAADARRNVAVGVADWSLDGSRVAWPVLADSVSTSSSLAELHPSSCARYPELPGVLGAATQLLLQQLHSAAPLIGDDSMRTALSRTSGTVTGALEYVASLHSVRVRMLDGGAGATVGRSSSPPPPPRAGTQPSTGWRIGTVNALKRKTAVHSANLKHEAWGVQRGAAGAPASAPAPPPSAVRALVLQLALTGSQLHMHGFACGLLLSGIATNARLGREVPVSLQQLPDKGMAVSARAYLRTAAAESGRGGDGAADILPWMVYLAQAYLSAGRVQEACFVLCQVLPFLPLLAADEGGAAHSVTTTLHAHVRGGSEQPASHSHVLHRLHVFPVHASLGGIPVQCLGKATVVAVPAPPGSQRARGAALLPSPLALLACRLWVRAQLAAGMFEAGAASCSFLLHLITRFHDSRCIQPVALPPPETGAAAVTRAKAAAGFLELRGRCLAAACRGRQRGAQPSLPLKELPGLLQERGLCTQAWQHVAREGTAPGQGGDVQRARALLTRNSFAGDVFHTQWDVFQAAVASLNSAALLFASFEMQDKARACRQHSALAQTDWALGQRQQLLPSSAGVPRCAVAPPGGSGAGGESPPHTPAVRRGARDGTIEALHGPICGVAQLYASLHVAYSWGLGTQALDTPFLQAWVPGPSVPQVDWHCRALLDVTGGHNSSTAGMWAHLAQAELHVVRGQQGSGGSDLEAEAKGMAHWTEAYDMFRELFLVGLSSPVLRRFDLFQSDDVVMFLERLLRTLCLFSVDFVREHIGVFDVVAACSDDAARARSCSLPPPPLAIVDAIRAAARALPSAELSKLEAAGCLQSDIRSVPTVLRDSGAWRGMQLTRAAMSAPSSVGEAAALESKVMGYSSGGAVYSAQLSPAFMQIIHPPRAAPPALEVALDNTPDVLVPPLDCADVHSTAAVGNAGRVLAASTLRAFGLSPALGAEAAARGVAALGRLLGSAAGGGREGGGTNPGAPASADGAFATGRSSQVSEGSTATTPDPPGVGGRGSRASSAARLPLPGAIHEGPLPAGESDPADTGGVAADSPAPDAASSVVGDLLDNRSYLAKLAGSSYRYAQFAAADGRQGAGVPKAQMTPAQRLRANREKYSTYPPRGARLGARRSKLSATLAGQRLLGSKVRAAGATTSARGSPLQRSETGTSVASLDSSNLALERGEAPAGGVPPLNTGALLKAFRSSPVSPLVVHEGGRQAVGRVAYGAGGSGTAQLLGVALGAARNLPVSAEGAARTALSELATGVASSVVYRRVTGGEDGGIFASAAFGGVGALRALHQAMPSQRPLTEVPLGHCAGAVVNEWLGCSWRGPVRAVRRSAVLHALRAQYPISALGMPAAPWGALLAAAEATGGQHSLHALQRSILCFIMQHSGTHIVYTPLCSSGPAVSQVAQTPDRLLGTPPLAAQAWGHAFHSAQDTTETPTLAARVRSVRLNAPVGGGMPQPAAVRSDGWRHWAVVDEYVRSMLHEQSWMGLSHKVRGAKAVQAWCAEVARRLQWGVLSSPSVDLKRLAVQLQSAGQVAGRKMSTSKHKRKRTFLSWVKAGEAQELPPPAPPVNIVAPGAARLLPWESVFHVGLKESLRPINKSTGPVVEGTAAALAQQQDDELRPLRVDVGEVSFVRARGLLALAHRAPLSATSVAAVLPVATAKGGKPLPSRAAAEAHSLEQLRRRHVTLDEAWTRPRALAAQMPPADVCGVGSSFSAMSGHSHAISGRARLNYVSAFGKTPSDTPALTPGPGLSADHSHARQAGVFTSPLSFVSMIWGNIRSIVHSSTRVVDARRLHTALRSPWRADESGVLILQHADFAEASEGFIRALAQPWLPVLCLPNCESQYREALAIVEAVLEAFSKSTPPSHTPDMLSALQYAANQASVRVGCSCVLFV